MNEGVGMTVDALTLQASIEVKPEALRAMGAEVAADFAAHDAKQAFKAQAKAWLDRELA